MLYLKIIILTETHLDIIDYYNVLC